jgi:transcriptional regulator with GAF, ATPase, and Fis domain
MMMEMDTRSEGEPVTREQEITKAFVELADTLVDDYDVVDLMHVLAERSVGLLAADAAGILLDDGRDNLVAVASTSHEAGLVELFVVQNVGGPCRDCIRTGQRVVNVEVDEATRRWPGFVEKVREVGFVSTHAFPLRLRSQVVGAINLFCRVHTELDDEAIAVAQGLADIATIGLLHQRAVRHHEVLSEQLHTALNSRIVIEQAKGVLAERAHVDVGTAFTLIRDYSRAGHHLLLDTAEAVIEGRVSVAELRAR